jgi:outer membrane protein
MKKLILTIALITSVAFVASAQRYCVIDTKYILESIPEYTQAQKQLDALAEQWQKEIDNRFQEVERMYKSYQAEAVMLTDALKKKREDEIISKKEKNL